MNAHPATSSISGDGFQHGRLEVPAAMQSLSVQGKFLFRGTEKIYVKGVTYGPFRPDEGGCEYHDPKAVSQDFIQMHRHGINTIRTYTVPPRWLLDLAQENGLQALVGLPWEQHVTFLSGTRPKDIQHRLAATVRECAGHPAILGY